MSDERGGDLGRIREHRAQGRSGRCQQGRPVPEAAAALPQDYRACRPGRLACDAMAPMHERVRMDMLVGRDHVRGVVPGQTCTEERGRGGEKGC